MSGEQDKQDPTPQRVPKPVSPATAPVEAPLDSGSQALAEALKSSFFIVKIVMVVLVVVFLGSGFFTVGPEERAMVLRFGKVVGVGEEALLGPGPHFAFPYPIDEVIRIPISQVLSVRSTAGWYFTTPEQEMAGTEPMPGLSLNPAVDGYVITADQNIIHVRATLFYRIEDPVGCVFGFAGTTNKSLGIEGTAQVVRDALDTALVETAGKFSVDDVLTRNVAGFKEELQRRVQEVLLAQQVGVVVEQVEIERKPPRQTEVKAAFDQVTHEVQQRDKVLNDARTYRNKVLSQGDAQAAGIVNAAESDRTRLEEDIKAFADRFNELLPRYREDRTLFTQLHLTETLSQVMTNVQGTIYLQDRSTGETRELRLLLNRLPQVDRPTAQKKD